MSATLTIHAEFSYFNTGERSVQEDCVLADRQKGIFVVADGFGGGAGLAAAKTACDEVQRFLFKEAGDMDATLPFVLRSYFSLAGNVLFNALIHANRKVIALNKGKSVHEKGGASVIAGFLDGDLLALANVGVCSAGLIREGKFQELVTPRSYGKLVNPFNEKDPVDAPLMAVGMSQDLEPEIFEYRLRPRDWLILHTDGISHEGLDGLAKLNASLSAESAVSRMGSDVKSVLDELVYRDNAALSLVCF